MNLSALQQAFIRSITANNADASDPHLLNLVDDNARLTAEDQLAIYRNNARMVLRRALEQTYPACLQTLGKDYFRQAARAYIQHHPSTTNDLNAYGEKLPGFFAELQKERAELREYAYLADLARLEYAHAAAYYAVADTPFDFTAFAECEAKECLRFELSTAVFLLQSDYPLLEIWQALRENAQKESLVVADSGREYLCVRRIHGRVRVERLQKERYALLDAIASGRALEELAAQFADIDSALPQLIADGWIRSFYSTSARPSPE